MRSQLSQALPAIGFPFNGAISAMELPDAIARMLGSTVGFQAGFIGGIVLHGFGEGGPRGPLQVMYKQEGPGQPLRNNCLQTVWALRALHHHERFGDEHGLEASGLSL